MRHYGDVDWSDLHALYIWAIRDLLHSYLFHLELPYLLTQVVYLKFKISEQIKMPIKIK